MRSRNYKASLAALVFAFTLCAAAPAHAHDPRAHAAEETAVYTCPMHPEVRSKKKGQCPKCKMDLRPANADEQAAGAEGMTATHDESQVSSKMSIPDVELVDQDGRKVRFYSDMLKGKTVVVNAFFTTCTSVCPPMNRSMEKLQEAFGDRVGKDVFLVSISVDPATDTPPRLKEYARRFHAKPGWVFLTGKKENVDWALYKVGQYVESKDDHTTIIVIGNEATGLWKKALGMAKPEELLQIVRSVADDKGESNDSGGGSK